jgi:hypothetical protein
MNGKRLSLFSVRETKGEVGETTLFLVHTNHKVSYTKRNLRATYSYT